MAHPLAKPPRDAHATRQALLVAAFEELQAVGFRAASLDRILARVGVTKGALYHHFPNKNALGLAVIEELIAPNSDEMFRLLADEQVDPIDALVGLVEREMAEKSDLDQVHGCPVCNLVQDMAAVDEQFRLRLVGIHEAWQGAIAKALARGQRQGRVRRDVDPARFASTLVAAYEGANVLARAAQDHAVYRRCMQGLIDLARALRAP